MFKEYSGLEAAKKFVELIDGEPDNPKTHWRVISSETGRARNLNGAISTHERDLVNDNEIRHNVYRVINAGGTTTEYIRTVNAWFVDGDDVELPEHWHLEPSFICQRDARHWHAYWCAELDTEADAAEFRRVQSRLAKHYGTDPSVCDLPRIMRVPGYHHHKRHQENSEIVTSPGYELRAPADGKRRTYNMAQVENGLPVVEVKVGGDGTGLHYVDEPDLPDHKRRALKYLRKVEPALDRDHGGGGQTHTYKVAAKLAEFALSPAGVVAVMFERDPLLGTSWAERCRRPWTEGDQEELINGSSEGGIVDRAVAKVLDNGNWGRKVLGASTAEDDDLPDDADQAPGSGRGSWFEPVAQLNETYAIVTGGDLAGNIADLSNPRSPVMLSKSKFALVMQTRKVTLPVPEGSDKEPETAPVAHLWLNWSGRREITGLEFVPPGSRQPDPSKHNLWQGYAVEPVDGTDHEGFLQHLADNVCNGDRALYLWLIDWLADLVQHPGRKRAVAVTLHSEDPGTGKSVVYEWVRAILGDHAYSASSAREITGQFNAHLAGCILLGVEEGYWSGSKADEGRLRSFISAPTLSLELKGSNITTLDNYARVLITSNENKAVPIQRKDRRWLVLDVNPRRKDDFAYWKPIFEALKGDGPANLLHYLLTVAVDDELLFRPPLTKAKIGQAVETSLGPVDRWWLSVLLDHRNPVTRGLTPGVERVDDTDRDGVFGTETRKETFYSDCEDLTGKGRINPVGFWRQLWKLLPRDASERKLKADGGRELWLPDRETCRKAFAEHYGCHWEDFEEDRG